MDQWPKINSLSRNQWKKRSFEKKSLSVELFSINRPKISYYQKSPYYGIAYFSGALANHIERISSEYALYQLVINYKR
jgi:hypothetical protein